MENPLGRMVLNPDVAVSFGGITAFIENGSGGATIQYRSVSGQQDTQSPGSAGSKVRGTQDASSSIRRTPKEYS